MVLERIFHLISGTRSAEGRRFGPPKSLEADFYNDAETSLDIVDHELDAYYTDPEISAALKKASDKKVNITIYTGRPQNGTVEHLKNMGINFSFYELPKDPVEHFAIVDGIDELREFPHSRNVDHCHITVYRKSGRIPIRFRELELLKYVGVKKED